MELFFVDRASLDDLPPEARGRVGPGVLREALDRAGVPDGMPFLLGDDGRPVKEVNDFLREMPSSGCRSQDTWRAYALDVFRFSRYLSAVEGVAPFEATFEHVERYRWMRLQGQRPVRPSTWNRELAALQRFYSWAERRGHVTAPPFRFGDGRGEKRNLTRRTNWWKRPWPGGTRTLPGPTSRRPREDDDEGPLPERLRRVAASYPLAQPRR